MKNETIVSDWMDADQVAEYLGFAGRNSVYAAKDRGLLPYYTLGRSIRFKKSELDALLESTKREATVK